jgi:arylsulfatase A-like enzyme
MSEIKNILFIMTDQMRADCLSAEGHPVVKTPNLDWLAKQGVRFDRAFVQSAVCGPSRMCFYTGRYVHAHRSYWNGVPLPMEELTIGDFMREAGIRAALCGKTHHVEDTDQIRRLKQRGLDKNKIFSKYAGLEPWETDEARGKGWIAYLKSKGYNLPFDEHPGAAPYIVSTPDGRWLNGWRFQSAAYPTVIREEDSDTAYMTRRAMEFIQNAGEEPWLLHLSYIKPHWPNVAPAPYHNMYDPASVPAPIRIPEELENPHPLHIPYREERRSVPFDREEVWRQMRATYYGLITQIDDHLGNLFRFLESKGRMKDTLIIFTSDHGEYMGDHWLFEKELFYEQAIRVPLIIYDPSVAADQTRGTVDHRFVESIDILPTCLDAFGLDIPRFIQGRSLLPLVRGEEVDEWRDAVFADWDFRFYQTGVRLSLPFERCRAWMIRDDHYKYVHFNGLPNMLFDLKNDPNEFYNLAADPKYKDVILEYQSRLIEWRQTYEDNSRGYLQEIRYKRAGVSNLPENILEFPKP